MHRICVLSPLLLGALAAQTITTRPQGVVSEGEDYTLPSWVRISPYTGYGGDNYDGKRITLKNWSVGWKDLEPKRGQYNWALVEQEFKKAREGHYGILLRLTSITHGAAWAKEGIIVRSVVPDWVISELQVPVDSIGARSHIVFSLLTIPGWHPQVADAFNALIAEFGKRGYPQRQELVGVYIHGISHSRGEEFNLVEETVRRFEKTLGLSPEALRQWMKKRMDAFAAAFRGVQYKLAWVGQETSFASTNEYRGIGEELVEYAYAKGAGIRGGGIEWYNDHLNRKTFAQTLGPDGYLITDETIPTIATVRFYGEENEEYGPSMAWRWGATQQDANRYRMATLRGLECRFRFIWTSRDAELLNPPLSEYARFSFGKTIQDTPDAWAYLREAVVMERPGYTKNFERWLLQRDVPGGMTKPARRIDRTHFPGGSRNAMYDYFARRTDLASGNKYIYFNLDDRFKVSLPVDIKVEVHDGSTCRWRVEYNSESGAATQTEWIQNKNDGKTRTVTFTLRDARFANALENGMDFRIACDGPEDVVVQWVRVVRQGN